MNQSDNYSAWQINEKDFPKKGTIEEQINFLIGYGILAPSTHNTQPWLFEVNREALYIRPNSDYRLAEGDPTGRNMLISLGACAFNVQVAAAHFGLSAGIHHEGNSVDDLAIILKFTKSTRTDSKLAELFDQITRRRSEKRILYSPALEEATLKDLSKSSQAGVSVGLLNDKKSIGQLADLCYAAASSYADKPLFARELSGWMRSNNTARYDGMPGFSSGLSNPKVLIGAAILKRTPNILKPMAKKYLQMIQTSPALGVISTPADGWQDWFRAGMAYEELSLQASKQDISLCPMAALIERPERKRLGKYFKDGKYPQMFFRLVKSNGVDHTPRRQLSRQSAEKAVVEKLKAEGLDVSLGSRRVGGHRINYITAGKGDPLLLIHGANIGWGQWAPNLKALAGRFKVIAVDLPGSGGSTPGDFNSFTFDTFVETMAGLIKELKLPAVRVVGHSFGGAIAIKLAGRKDVKVKSLVLLDPMGFTRNVPGRQKLVTLRPFAKLLSKTAIKPTRDNMQKFLAEPLVRHDGITPELVDYYWTAIKASHYNHPILFMHSLTRPFLIKQELLLIDEFNRLKQPTLVIIGDKDPLTPLSKVKREIARNANTRLEVFANTGHVPSLERPERFNELVLNT